VVLSAALLRARSRDTLLASLLYPVVVPVFLAGAQATSQLLDPGLPDLQGAVFWTRFLLVADLVLIVVGLWPSSRWSPGSDRPRNHRPVGRDLHGVISSPNALEHRLFRGEGPVHHDQPAGGVAGIYFAAIGKPDWAGYAILAGYFFGDALDGPVARATGTGNRFGSEFDSAADHIGQGIAPAVVVFSAYHLIGQTTIGVALMAAR
jgi:phosphatidylglycerophosphate synthase